MKHADLAKKVIYCAKNFYSPGDASMFSLLKESGYFELYELISETDIEKALSLYPECINEWLIWSENKRTGSGWYITQSENKNYLVGYYADADNIKTIEYTNAIEACSAFIMQEVEAIRTSKNVEFF